MCKPMRSDEEIYAYRDVMITVRDHTNIPAVRSEVSNAVEIITQLLSERTLLRATIVRQEEALCAAAARMSLDFTANGHNLFDEEGLNDPPARRPHAQ